MRKLITWAIVTLGIAAIARRLRKRKDAPASSQEATPAGDPADDLRRKLEQSRSEGVSQEAPPEASVSERRAEVHDEGRAALDEMRSRDPGQ
jgi:hypothetical protein